MESVKPFIEHYTQMHAPWSNSDLGNLAKKNAESIHNDWGVGYQTSCGGTGLLLYLAVADHQIYISRGKALIRILPNGRLRFVIEQMKPDLRDFQYGRALEVGIDLITKFASGQRPDRDQACKDLLGLLCFVGPFVALLLTITSWRARRIQRQARLRREFRDNLSKLDRDRARALRGQYKATSCPICLEDFLCNPNIVTNEKTGLLDDDDEEVFGSDGRPLKLLSCGHVFDQTCFEDLSRHPTAGNSSEGGLLCPICRAPVTPQETEAAATHRLLDEPSYRDERNFRLHQLRERYPTFTGPYNVYQWYDPNYSGSLLADYERMEREQLAAEARAADTSREAERRAHNDNSGWSSSDWEGTPDWGGTSDFGGGGADGGGVGGSW